MENIIYLKKTGLSTSITKSRTCFIKYGLLTNITKNITLFYIYKNLHEIALFGVFLSISNINVEAL